MFKELQIHACFGERTGYQIHASRFFPELEKAAAECGATDVSGTVHISLLDTVTASQVKERHPCPSILYNVWESTEQPQEFLNALGLYDQLWVPSEWQRAASIAQGIPEEFVKVVPEGVDPEVYKPECVAVRSIEHALRRDFPETNPFVFLHVGQWQPRKSTLEICQAFIKAFPRNGNYANENVRLYLSADTLFPSDSYSSTEERLVAYGVNDPRIIPVHFEERDAYVRRLQTSHVFVSCSRSEGWGLPIIEAMACGVPTIVADFGGPTEYAGDALLVRVPELKKPEGIYGGWDVPGFWGEPDYDHLAEVMRDAYDNWEAHRAKALKTAETIRTKFSWRAAAEKAVTHLRELHATVKQIEIELQAEAEPEVVDPEPEIRKYAERRGYIITGIRKQTAIFCIDSHPDTQEKLDTLKETVMQIQDLGYPILLTSHLPLPAEIVSLADYYIYDRHDILSGDDKPIYWCQDDKGNRREVEASIPCHALAAVHNVRNALDFCGTKYDWIYQMSSDAEVDVQSWLKAVQAHGDKDLVCIRWEGKAQTISGQILAGRPHAMNAIVPRLSTWDDFKALYGDDRFCSERGLYKFVERDVGLENVAWLEMDIGNRFSQVDQKAWAEVNNMADTFECHFIDGPYLLIKGYSDREYDVSYTYDNVNVYGLKQKPGVWSRPDCKFYRPWKIDVSLNGQPVYHHELDLRGKRVLLCFGSKALGDTIAWMPYVEEFRKKHGCHVVCSGWWQEVFDYPDIEFIKPGAQVPDIYASYDIGCFDDQPNKNPLNWRTVPLQKVAADILGLDYEPIKPRVKFLPAASPDLADKKYVCFSEFSTMRNKMWNRPGAWQKIVDYLNSRGYACVSISPEQTQLQNVVRHNGQSIQATLADINGCEFYVGLNHGPAWIAYCLDKPTIMITGVSEVWNDYQNPHRIAINHEVCGVGCFNDPSLPIQRDWEWCPRGKDYACTKEITEDMVIQEIEKVILEVERGKEG